MGNILNKFAILTAITYILHAQKIPKKTLD